MTFFFAPYSTFGGRSYFVNADPLVDPTLLEHKDCLLTESVADSNIWTKADYEYGPPTDTNCPPAFLESGDPAAADILDQSVSWFYLILTILSWDKF